MSCQHKRPGRTARAERIERLQEREAKKRYRNKVRVIIPTGRRRWDDRPGKIVAVGIPPQEEDWNIA